MERIEEYKTVRAQETANLDQLVNNELKKGFQPYGNPFSIGNWMCQAMVKFADS